MKRFRIPYAFRPLNSESYIWIHENGEALDVVGSNYDDSYIPQHSYTCSDVDTACLSCHDSDNLDSASYSLTGDNLNHSRASRMEPFI